LVCPLPLPQACAWAIDELKAVVLIWKKEFFEGGEVWKENQESRERLMRGGRI
jgi:molybdopterin synthase catalytic subunit